jgi:glycosyltransferase involved in cell wall biosynthesis
MPWGVTVALCCYNSATRLPETLSHLKQVQTSVPWEVLIIDNASMDGTAEVAQAHWGVSSPGPMRIVREPQAGLSHARQRAFAEACYDIVSFIDDDNWVSPNWVQSVSDLLGANAQAGVCGGLIEAACEVSPPPWFKDYAIDYAIGKQGRTEGDNTKFHGFMWGAGMSVRKSAWQGLVAKGFRPALTDRKGSQLSSGGDTELCLALRLAGWRLYYSSQIKMQHFIPAFRLDWRYLRRMYRGFGAATVGTDPYYAMLKGEPWARRGRKWLPEVGATLKHILSQRRQTLLRFSSDALEGDKSAPTIEFGIGRVQQLLRQRSAYDQSFAKIENASWRLTN